MQTRTYIIIGTSAAGLSAAMTLSRQDKHARIIAISDEKEPPYNKCFLADYLSGDKTDEQLFTLRAVLEENPRFSLLLGLSVTHIDSFQMVIKLSDGQVIAYDRLFMSMGSSACMPTVLSAARYAGLFTFSTLADVNRILAYIEQTSVRNAVVIGAGLNGLECANALISHGVAITLIERGDRIVSYHTDEKGAAFIQAAALRAGITIRTQCQIEQVQEQAGSVTGVLLSDGTYIPVELVICTIGMRPNSALAREAGIELISNHVRVDNRLQTSEKNIYAGGDLVAASCIITGRLVPSTTWPDAVLQGSIAAYNMLGQDRIYPGIIGHTVSHMFGLDIAACGTLRGPSQQEVVIVERPGTYRVFELDADILKAYCLIGATAHAISVCRRALLTRQPISQDELRTL